jgi:hypothetical protein
VDPLLGKLLQPRQQLPRPKEHHQELQLLQLQLQLLPVQELLPVWHQLQQQLQQLQQLQLLQVGGQHPALLRRLQQLVQLACLLTQRKRLQPQPQPQHLQHLQVLLGALLQQQLPLLLPVEDL